ncbi:hypothetical protein Tco_0289966 [Tanacetum coccineum]
MISDELGEMRVRNHRILGRRNSTIVLLFHISVDAHSSVRSEACQLLPKLMSVHRRPSGRLSSSMDLARAGHAKSSRDPTVFSAGFSNSHIAISLE